ncbi:hypothetical protein ISCGN_013938 [Ixodes scapularis]
MPNSKPQKRCFQVFLKSYTSKFPCFMPPKKQEKFGLCSTYTCDITFGDIALPEAQLKHVDTKQPSIYVQELAVMVFGTEALTNCCLTGPAMKGKLPKKGVRDLIAFVTANSLEKLGSP